MRLLYSLLLMLLSPLLVIYTITQQQRRQGDRRFVLQRLGLFKRCSTTHASKAIWFHAASVGETNSILPLVRTLGADFPDLRVVVTTNTPEAARIVNSRLGRDVEHYFFTTDFPFAAARLVELIQPVALFVVETEIWPNLYHYCFRHSIPVIIVNARLSKKTINANRFIKKLYRDTLPGVQALLCRSQADADNYIALGADPARVSFFGNLKFAAARQVLSEPVPELAARPYWLAVSTHAGEESILARVFKQTATNLLLVIAPRHPQRSADIVKELRHNGLEVSVRSRGDAVVASTDIYLADTVGEINALLAGDAQVVYVGGSLVATGGHNVLEPAIYGKATLTGPNVQNFRDEVLFLQEFDAIRQVEDEADLLRAVEELLASPLRRKQLGSNALRAIQSCQNILGKYHAELSNIIRQETQKTPVK